MDCLEFLERDQAFVLTTGDEKLAARVRADGWGRTNLGGAKPPGKFALYTKEPYAALSEVQYAQVGGEAHRRLAPLLFAYRQSLAKSSNFRVTVPDALPDSLAPMPFQRAGVSRALEMPHALLGDDMGLGKTAQAIMVANSLGADRVLCVVPAVARLQWADSIKVWSTIPRVYRGIYIIQASKDGVSPSANYTVISYDLLRRPAIYRALMALRFDLLVLDEAHYLKEVTSKRSQAAFGSLDGKIEGVASRCSKTLALTGTPLPNRPREAYNMARHLAWDSIDWLSEDAFVRRFNPSATMHTGHVLEYVSRLPELRARMRCNFMVRRKKLDVLPQLPEKAYELTYVEPTGEIKKALKAESLLHFDPDKFEDLDMETRGHIAAVRHAMGIAKIPRVVEHLAMLLNGGLEKVLVATYHRKVLAALAEKLESHGVAVIAGGQTPLQRERQKLKFINDPSCKILLGQIQAAGEALDGFQKVCRWGVFAEASWVFKDNEQITDRLWRMGQHRDVFWQFLVAPGSLDEKILGKAIGKGRNVEKTLDGGSVGF